ncbi:MAG: hypothetical protein Q4D81_02150 [Eubacteriales bacterium]|nr:hypothetical protein [Eubacteriales bacterium]
MEEYPPESENAAQIPSFVSKDEQVSRNLRDLEKQTKALRKIVDREQKKGTFLEMLSYPLDLKNYPQVTVVWKTQEDGSYLHNLVSLAADETEGQPITCKEALERTGMTGVDLSLQVGKLAMESGLRGDLTATEMQGFRIDENGEVVEIYMKLTTEVREDEDPRDEEHFFAYVLSEEKLEKLSERGFNVP